MFNKKSATKYDTSVSPITVYIVFLDTENAFYHKLLKPGFRHVSIAIQGPLRSGDAGETDVLVMDTSENTLNCYWCRRDKWVEQLEAVKQAGEGTYVKVTRCVSTNDSPLFPLKLIAGCSAMGAYAAGIKRFMLTPYCLYKALCELSTDRLKMKSNGILNISIAGD